MSDNGNTVANRELSLGQANEFWQKLRQAGATPEMVQKVVENPNNIIAKEIVKTIKTFDFPSLSEAKEIMGTNHFFGPKQWFDFLGWKIKTPQIPWKKSELMALRGSYFLFLGIESHGGLILSTDAWIKLLKDKEFGLSTNDGGNYVHSSFKTETCKPRWYLMHIGVFPKSKHLYADDMLNLMSDFCECPSLVERYLSNILYYVLNDTCLDNDTWACVNNLYRGSKDSILVRYYQSALCIGSYNLLYQKEADIGIAASMSLPH